MPDQYPSPVSGPTEYPGQITPEDELAAIEREKKLQLLRSFAPPEPFAGPSIAERFVESIPTTAEGWKQAVKDTGESLSDPRVVIPLLAGLATAVATRGQSLIIPQIIGVAATEGLATYAGEKMAGTPEGEAKAWGALDTLLGGLGAGPMVGSIKQMDELAPSFRRAAGELMPGVHVPFEKNLAMLKKKASKGALPKRGSIMEMIDAAVQAGANRNEIEDAVARYSDAYDYYLQTLGSTGSTVGEIYSDLSRQDFLDIIESAGPTPSFAERRAMSDVDRKSAGPRRIVLPEGWRIWPTSGRNRVAPQSATEGYLVTGTGTRRPIGTDVQINEAGQPTIPQLAVNFDVPWRPVYGRSFHLPLNNEDLVDVREITVQNPKFMRRDEDFVEKAQIHYDQPHTLQLHTRSVVVDDPELGRGQLIHEVQSDAAAAAKDTDVGAAVSRSSLVDTDESHVPTSRARYLKAGFPEPPKGVVDIVDTSEFLVVKDRGKDSTYTAGIFRYRDDSGRVIENHYRINDGKPPTDDELRGLISIRTPDVGLSVGGSYIDILPWRSRKYGGGKRILTGAQRDHADFMTDKIGSLSPGDYVSVHMDGENAHVRSVIEEYARQKKLHLSDFMGGESSYNELGDSYFVFKIGGRGGLDPETGVRELSTVILNSKRATPSQSMLVKDKAWMRMGVRVAIADSIARGDDFISLASSKVAVYSDSPIYDRQLRKEFKKAIRELDPDAKVFPHKVAGTNHESATVVTTEKMREAYNEKGISMYSGVPLAAIAANQGMPEEAEKPQVNQGNLPHAMGLLK